MITTLAAPERRARRTTAPSRRRRRVPVRPQDLVDLMARRPDLAGVHKPADVTVEAIRWSV
jgi:hypothetical protein